MIPALRFHNPRARLIDWSCAEGEKCLLSAPTGWGKSRWLRQLALLSDTASTRLEWRGKSVEASDVSRYRRQWIYMPQASYRSCDTVEAHLREVLALTGHASADVFLESFRAALKEMGVNQLDVKRRTLQEVSGGELQVISLVRTVLLNPEGIFLDEPTAAMDGALRQRAESWMLGRFKGAFIWVSHDEDQVRRLCAAGARSLVLSL